MALTLQKFLSHPTPLLIYLFYACNISPTSAKAGARRTRKGGPPPQTLQLFDPVDFLHATGGIMSGIVVALSPAPEPGTRRPAAGVLPDGFPHNHALISYSNSRGRIW